MCERTVESKKYVLKLNLVRGEQMGNKMGMTIETDLVLIGSGVSGLTAALTAAEGGAKVIVFEKQRSLGGSSNFFQGIFAVESEMQRQRLINYNRDEAFKKIMEYSHWRANARLVRAFVDESGGTIEWLQKQGVEFVDVVNYAPGGPATYHVVKGEGAAVVKTLSMNAKVKGVDLRLSMPVKKILKEGNRIAGVIAEIDGEEYTVVSKAVVIASGGYANNREWIKKYSGFDLGVNMIPFGNVDKMGDGIRMAWEVGAAEDGMGVLEMFRVGPVAPDFALKGQIEFAVMQPDLWVDPRGERFCDEAVVFFDSYMGNANARYKEGYTFSIFDDTIKQRLLERGVDRSIMYENPPGTRPINLDRELNAVLERGSMEVFKADSIEELAEKIGMESAVLRATVDEYNRFCEKGHDDHFAKDPKYLRPLKGPKFYAVKARSSFLGTLGGIKINHKTEVVDKKEKVIPGLYAVGFDAAGMWGDSYSINDSPGASAGFAINSGRIAGKNASIFVSAK
jgi:fumarate reductase flavoprotein subunit